MRTPEDDDEQAEEAGSLADGFGTVVSGEADGIDDTSFGVGSTAPDDTSALLSGPEDDLVDDGETQVFLDPQDSYTDTDLDLTGDGVVDSSDLHEAVSGFFDFSTEDDGSYHGDTDPHAGDHESVDPVLDAPHSDGLFGLFDFFDG